jgi:hypothetical protein
MSDDGKVLRFRRGGYIGKNSSNDDPRWHLPVANYGRNELYTVMRALCGYELSLRHQIKYGVEISKAKKPSRGELCKRCIDAAARLAQEQAEREAAARASAPRQDDDGNVYLAYYVAPYGFCWDLRSPHLEVCMGGMGEPVVDTVPIAPPAPLTMLATTDYFKRLCDDYVSYRGATERSAE